MPQNYYPWDAYISIKAFLDSENSWLLKPWYPRTQLWSRRSSKFIVEIYRKKPLNVGQFVKLWGKPIKLWNFVNICKLYSILEEFHIKKIVKNINARTAVHMSDVAHGSLELFVLQFENIENKYCQLL